MNCTVLLIIIILSIVLLIVLYIVNTNSKIAPIYESFANTNVFNINSYGASQNSDDNSGAILKAIKAASLSTPSTVYIPAGSYFIKCFTISNVNNITINLDANAVLKGPNSGSASAWNWNGSQGLISISNCNNISLTGSYVYGSLSNYSRINGNGQVWWQNVKNTPNRPYLFTISDSNNCTISGITFQDSPKFNVVMTRCQGLTIHDVSITAASDSPNTDGLHVADAVTNSTFYNCDISNGDDCVVINSDVGPTNNINIHDINIGSGHGLSLGSAIKSSISNITFNNITMNNVDYGTRIKVAAVSSSTPYTISSITFSNITMNGINNGPILITTEYSGNNSVVQFQNISYSNIKSSNSKYYASFVLENSKQLINPIAINNVQINNVSDSDKGESGNTIKNVSKDSFKFSGNNSILNPELS